jgi:proline racemase
VVIDTEPGPVETVVRLERDQVREVTLKRTPAFVVQPAQLVKVPEVGEAPLDIAVGAGNVFAIVEVRQAIAEQLPVRVPRQGEVAVDNVILHEPPEARGVSRSALVWGPGQVDARPAARVLARAWRCSTTAGDCASATP